MIMQHTKSQPNLHPATSPAAILLASFLATAGTSVFAFALPLMSLDERVSGSWLGSAFALYFLARLVAAPLGGIWADRCGPRRPFLTACTLSLAAPLLPWFAPGLSALMAVQMFLGIASGIARPAALSGIATVSRPEDLSLWLGRNAAMTNAALLFGPILGGVLYLDRSMQPVFLGLAACMAFAALAARRLPSARASQPASTAATQATATVIPSNTTHSPRKIFPLLLAITGRTLGIGTLTAFYPLLLAQTLPHEQTMDRIVLALIFALGNVVAMIGLPFSGRLVKTNNQYGLTVLGMVISALALFGLGLAQNQWHYMGLGVVLGLGMIISIPASMALMATFSPHTGKLFGAAHSAAGVGLLLGPILGGLAVRWTSETGPALTLASLAGLMLTTPMLLAGLRKRAGWSRAYTGLATVSIATLLSGLTLASGLLPTNHDDTLYRYTDTAMGTVVRFTLDTPDKAIAERVAMDTMTLIRHLQSDLDHRSPSGSIGRINREAGLHAVTVTPRALALIQRSLDYADRTNGAFDPTVGAVTTLPFFFALDPTMAEAKADLVNWQKVHILENTIFLERKGMALDLGGIAKGAIIDEAARVLQEKGITSGMVEAGGDFRVFGERDWHIGVQDPRGDEDQTLETLTLRNRAICTSGDYRRFVMTGPSGKARQHHILNPHSMTSASGAISVTVMADTAEEADALATSLFVMGPAKGLDFLQNCPKNIQAQWITPDLQLISSPDFPAQ